MNSARGMRSVSALRLTHGENSEGAVDQYRQGLQKGSSPERHPRELSNHELPILLSPGDLTALWSPSNLQREQSIVRDAPQSVEYCVKVRVARSQRHGAAA